tara:strand:- start:1871 stop:2548 length:678 start_codon:yes stop_codon:yes gene_type:complete
MIFLIYSNKKSNGTYIGVHKYYNDKSFKWSFDEILVIENLKFQVISILTNPEIPEKHFTIGNTIFFKSNDEYSLTKTFKIAHNNNDSLVLKNTLETKLFRKLPDSLKSKNNDKIDLKNKLFELKTDSFIDTLFFKNDFYLRKSNQPDRKWESPFWELKEVNEFKFLFTGDFSTLFVIVKNKNNYFLYKVLKDRIIKFELNEIIGDLTEINKIIKRVELMKEKNVW